MPGFVVEISALYIIIMARACKSKVRSAFMA